MAEAKIKAITYVVVLTLTQDEAEIVRRLCRDYATPLIGVMPSDWRVADGVRSVIDKVERATKYETQ